MQGKIWQKYHKNRRQIFNMLANLLKHLTIIDNNLNAQRIAIYALDVPASRINNSSLQLLLDCDKRFYNRKNYNTILYGWTLKYKNGSLIATAPLRNVFFPSVAKGRVV